MEHLNEAGMWRVLLSVTWKPGVSRVYRICKTHPTHIIQKQNCCFVNWEKITSFINSPLPSPNTRESSPSFETRNERKPQTTFDRPW